MDILGPLTWIGIVVLIVDLVALASIWTSSLHSTKAKLLWTILVALLPVVGAAAWFPLGREIRRG
ncbi:MAG TPA: PLDc N-terminal domain-containing protein [Gemmatimonadales bacterium]|nr:PLDc N-terminal domain-containing protein [Gemmatimonadales bacterium]